MKRRNFLKGALASGAAAPFVMSRRDIPIDGIVEADAPLPANVTAIERDGMRYAEPQVDVVAGGCLVADWVCDGEDVDLLRVFNVETGEVFFYDRELQLVEPVGDLFVCS